MPRVPKVYGGIRTGRRCPTPSLDSAERCGFRASPGRTSGSGTRNVVVVDPYASLRIGAVNPGQQFINVSVQAVPVLIPGRSATAGVRVVADQLPFPSKSLNSGRLWRAGDPAQQG